MFSGQSEWQEYPEEGILVSSKGQTGISLRAHPDTGNRDYEDYQIDLTVAYVDRYEVGEYEGSQNVTNDYVEPSTRMAYGSSGAPYFEKCEYRGYHSDSSGTKWGLYANPARYKAKHITRYDMFRKNLLPSTVQGSRTSILNFYDSGG